MKIGEESEDLDKLMTTLLAEMEAREASESTKVTSSKPPSYQSTPNSHSTASSLVAGAQAVQCVYCRGSHYSASCTAVRSINKRKELLTRSGRCFNCLKHNHRAKDCDRARNRRHCNRRHHQSLCELPMRNSILLTMTQLLQT